MQSIINTLSSQYFPTSQFNNNTKDISFINLKRLFESVKKDLETIITQDKFYVSTNTGVGKIALCPWVGIHSKDLKFNSKPQSGVYISILWKLDGSGICISFQKGTDNSTPTEVVNTVDMIRNKYGIINYSETIDLKRNGVNGRPKSYERANIIGECLSLKNIDDFKNILIDFLNYYTEIVELKVQRQNLSNDIESEDQDYQAPESGSSNSNKTYWKRDKNVRDKALKNASYQCEIDPTHITFEIDGHMFMEGHHLIPMEYQDQYLHQTLDIEENIVSLCPNCHRKIHYGESSDKLQLISKLFKIREETLSKKFDVNIRQLESYYYDI